ncbi:MAG: family 16 glycosylhydrolase [Bacteroidota bacterium]|nr:family 16 glycosylhydrolase [Bacteroidota bacterium]
MISIAFPYRYGFVLLMLSTTFLSCSKSSSDSNRSQPSLSIENISAVTDSVNTKIKFIVTVDAVSTSAITVDYTTMEGTAKANVDFVPVSGKLTLSPNTTKGEIEVSIIGRKVLSGSQQLYLQFSNPSGASLKIDKATAFLQNPGFDYQLVWKDEFDSNALNTKDWNYETGGNGWGNNELQNYTSGTNNAYIESGMLVIEAKKERLGSNAYTSARLTTKGKVKFTYGKIEIRAKLPATKGIWPALWMLGNNIDQVSWPACGEIDITEQINKETPARVYGTAHWGTNSSTHLQAGGNYTLSSGYFSDDFHIYSIEWESDKIQWFVDGIMYYRLVKGQVTGGINPFDADFFLIMNVAVGGSWPGNPDATSVFPQKMLVDYVRVYQK